MNQKQQPLNRQQSTSSTSTSSPSNNPLITNNISSPQTSHISGISKQTRSMIAGRRNDHRDVYVPAHRQYLLRLLNQKEPFLFSPQSTSKDTLILPIAVDSPQQGQVDLILIIGKPNKIQKKSISKRIFQVTLHKKLNSKLYNFFHQAVTLEKLKQSINGNQLFKKLKHSRGEKLNDVISTMNQFWLVILEKVSKIVAKGVYTFNEIEKQYPYFENQHTDYISILMKMITPTQVQKNGNSVYTNPLEMESSNQEKYLKLSKISSYNNLNQSSQSIRSNQLIATPPPPILGALNQRIGGQASGVRSSFGGGGNNNNKSIVQDSGGGSFLNSRELSSFNKVNGNDCKIQHEYKSDQSEDLNEERKVIDIDIQSERKLQECGNKAIDLAINGYLFEFFRDDASNSDKENHFTRGYNKSGNITYICYNRDSGRFSSVFIQMQNVPTVHTIKEVPAPKLKKESKLNLVKEE